MVDLKELLFFRANAELDARARMGKDYTVEEKIAQEERFASVCQVIEEAGLKDEFREWKRRHGLR